LHAQQGDVKIIKLTVQNKAHQIDLLVKSKGARKSCDTAPLFVHHSFWELAKK